MAHHCDPDLNADNYTLMDPDNYQISALRADYSTQLGPQNSANSTSSGSSSSRSFWTLRKVLITAGALIGIGILVPCMVFLISIFRILF